jgi:cytochrome c-type biogenesis protein
MATIALAWIAGLLSTLSPCVLPILPIVLGTAASEHKLGPAALAAGLASSFVIVGLGLATVGYAAGVEAAHFRYVSAVLMVGIGALLLVPSLQERAVVAMGPAANWASGRLESTQQSGLAGQFLVGVLLGAVWSPCVGPTLGAASVLASRGENLGEVALTMAAFGVGAALPLLAIGMMSREAVLRLRGRMMAAGSNMKAWLGVALIVIGVLVMTGLDKSIEAVMVAWSPEWLTTLTTRF